MTKTMRRDEMSPAHATHFRATDEDDDAEARKQDAANDLAEQLRREFTDNAPELGGFYGDVMTAAIGSVNWYEIAENWLSEIDEDEDA